MTPALMPRVPEVELKDWLEWAGMKLLAMNISSPAPRGPHVSWPSFAQDHRTAYGYTGERLRPGQPRGNEIELMDQIFALVNLVSEATPRRIIHCRSLVTPVSNRYMYSWTRIAFMLHCDRKTVMRIYQKGLTEIAINITPAKVDAIRKSLTILTL